jgi:HD-GYP domain-containing protein (c-di-GMP phosphodiesterase class II)
MMPHDERKLTEYQLNTRPAQGVGSRHAVSLQNRAHLGQVKSRSTWELFVESASFDHLEETPSKNNSISLRTSESPVFQEKGTVSSFEQCLHYLSVLGYKRRFKEAYNLAESNQYNTDFEEGQRLRLQVEAVWHRYLNNPAVESKSCIRRLNELYVQIQKKSSLEDMVILKPIIYLYQGRIHYDNRKYGIALRWYKEGLAQGEPNTLTQARLFDSMAIYYEQAGHFTHAFQLMQTSLKIKSTTLFIHECGVSYQMLGQTSLLIEQFSDAQRYIERALAIATEMKEVRRETELINDLIKIAIINNQLVKALHLVQESLTRSKASQLWSAYGTAKLYLGYIHFLNHEYQDCHNILIYEVIPLFKEHREEKGYGIAFRLMGALLQAMEKPRDALKMLSESIAIFKKQGRSDELAKTYYEQARLYISMQQKDLAIQSLFRAFHVAQKYNLLFLVRPIEDELFILAPEQWEKIVEHRLKQDALSVLTMKSVDTTTDLSDTDDPDAKNKETFHSEHLVKNSPNALMSLLRLGQAIAAERELDNILSLVREETVKALEAERCTVFVYDKESNELWSKVASGIEGSTTLRIRADKGLAGHVLKMGEALNIVDVYNDPRFNQDIDRQTGYRTRNVLCIPILNRDNESIGVVQVLNKRVGSFTKADEDLLRAIAATTGITLENAMMAKEQKRSFESFIVTLSSTIDARDPITAGHSERVADYCMLVGDEMQMTTTDLEVLRFSALLHDIGKIGIREDVLTKEGRLTIDEYKHIQEHARYTFEILQNIHFADHLKEVPMIAASHHERVDGKGYYKGLKGDEIPLLGRIIALSDVFDAITSLRHYRSRMPFEKVLAILQKDAGSHFDTEVVEMFLKVPLYRLAEILVKERGVKKMKDVVSMVKYIDRHVTLKEFNMLLSKPIKSSAEQELERYFSNIYYVLPPKKQDHI